MLKNSFQHLPGVGTTVEKNMWASGITDWDSLSNPLLIPKASKRIQTLRNHIPESFQNIDDPRYFSEHLPAALHWRFFPEFRKRTAFIDIETTGLDIDWGGNITTIALYDGHCLKYYVQGKNLDAFPDDIKRYDVIVTYNGKTFDVPFIESCFRITLSQAHIDLRYVLKSLGYGGGLKRCEKALGVDRGELEGVDGFFAVLLWDDYRRNKNQKALETLLAYNIEDVVNLETLMVLAYNMKLNDTPFLKTHEMPHPKPPEIPFKADRRTIEKIKHEAMFI